MAGTKVKPEEYLYFQPENAKKFIVTAYKLDSRKGLMFDVTLNGGLRISETLAIKASDINFKTEKIRVTTLKRKDKKKVIDILYPSSTLRICKALIEHLNLKPADRLFPWTRQWAWKCFKQVLEYCQMSKLYSPHALRHAHGVMIAEITHGDPIKIAKRLRHSSINYVYTYTHLTDGIQEEIVKGIEAYNKKG